MYVLLVCIFSANLDPQITSVSIPARLRNPQSLLPLLHPLMTASADGYGGSKPSLSSASLLLPVSLAA
jgi:hypothetical protein